MKRWFKYIKPYLPFTDCHPDAVGGYADGVRDHRLNVDFPKSLLAKIPEDKRAAICDCLAEDPRPSYQNDPERVYGMDYGGVSVRFSVDGRVLTVRGLDLSKK